MWREQGLKLPLCWLIHLISVLQIWKSEINLHGWNTDPNQDMPQLNSETQTYVEDESRSRDHLPTSYLQPGVSWDQLSTCLEESAEPQCKGHKRMCWREKTWSTSLAHWLYTSPHCPSLGVSPGVLTPWRGCGSCCDNLTLHMQMPKSWLWPWITPVDFVLPIARAGSSCQPSTMPHGTPTMEQLWARTFRQ